MMESGPEAAGVKAHVATPEPFNVDVHSVADPAWKTTVPPGCPTPVTVAVSVSVMPCPAGFGLAESVMEEAAWLTVSMATDELDEAYPLVLVYVAETGYERAARPETVVVAVPPDMVAI